MTCLEYGDSDKSRTSAPLLPRFDGGAIERLRAVRGFIREVAARQGVHGAGQVCRGHPNLPRIKSSAAEQSGSAAESGHGAPHGRVRTAVDTAVASRSEA